MNISQLKSLWISEKEAFKEKELGALQNFVRKVFECVELFNLEEGKESTAPHDRQNVFIQEDTDNKKKNRHDFVLYLVVNQIQIKIPVEVEKHENIKAGEKQIENYRELYNAVYAILTDGYEWRFYEGDFVRKKLRLDEILDDPEIFQTFWKEYTLPETYYVSFFEGMGSKWLFEKEGLHVEENRETFFEDITKVIHDFKYKLRLSEYFKNEKFPDKVATEISYAYVIQYILYKTLVDNDYSNKKKEFKERFKEVLKSLKSEIFGEVLTQATHIAEFISENLYRPFSAEQKYIEERLNEIRRQAKKSISDVSAWLDIFIFIKKYNFASVRNELFGYIYENYLKELYEDRNKGQYFTDPAVVEYMLDEIGYTTNEIKSRIKIKPDNPDISIIDPACGSGTFLYSAANRIIDAVYRGDEKTAKEAENLISENIFGLDIEEFPLYLAEMGVLMKMLPLIVTSKLNNPMEKKIKLFKTEDSISEFVDMMHSISEKTGQKEMFLGDRIDVSRFMRDEQNLAEMKQSMRPPRRRFDFVIGNPPYIGYNECCKQKIPFTQMIKRKTLSMGDVYGVNLNTVPKRIKPYSPKPNIYAFFIVLGLSLLKSDSRIAYIIPQGILTSSDLDVLRYHLSRHTKIEKLITFAGRMFIGRGLRQNRPVPTSSLIFVANSTQSKNNEVEITNFEDLQINSFQQYFNDTKRSQKKLEQIFLYNNLENWNFVTKDKANEAFLTEYSCNSLSIEQFRNTLNESDDLIFDGGVKIDQSFVKDRQNDNDFEIFDYKKNKWDLYKPIVSKAFYAESNPIEFIPGSQKLKAFTKSHKIIWRTKFNDRFQYTNRHILLVNNQSLIVSSDNKANLLFFFSCLNNPINMRILKDKLLLPNETNYLVPIKAIKQYIRIPKITKDNGFIKDEILICQEEMLGLEDCQVQDFVDFSNIAKQKYDSAEIRGNNLVLIQADAEYKAPIKSKKDLVKIVLRENFGDKDLFPGEIPLSELKYLPAIDTKSQKSLKDYIDDLIFALYFKIPIKTVNINLAGEIKELCRQNKYYDYIQKQRQ